MPLIVTLAAFAGLAAEAYRPASGALLADLTPEGDRLTAFALYRLAINLGFAAGPAAAGLLADARSPRCSSQTPLTSIVYGLVALAAFPHGQRIARHEERRGEGFRIVVHDRGFLRSSSPAPSLPPSSTCSTPRRFRSPCRTPASRSRSTGRWRR